MLELDRIICGDCLEAGRGSPSEARQLLPAAARGGRPAMRASRRSGRFSYPPDLQEKVDAYRRARKLSPLIQDAIRRAPWPPEE